MESTWKVPEQIKCCACGNILDLAGKTAFTTMPCPQCGAGTIVPGLLDTFLLLGMLGGSETGEVYETFDTEKNRYLALKILRPEWVAHPGWLDNLKREANAAADLRHPHIAAVYGIGEKEGKVYLSMELLRGGSLTDRVQKSGRLTEKDSLELGIKIAGALRDAHQRGVLHRDIRPGNILFDETGSPKLVEFGLSRPPAFEKHGLEYQAPEKLTGQADDVLSDIFSFGSTLLFAMEGRAPSLQTEAPLPWERRLGRPANGVHHDGAQRVLGKLHAANRADRYATWDEVVRALQDALKSAGGSATIPHKLPMPAVSSTPPPPKLPVGAVVWGLILVGVVMAGAMYRKEVMRFVNRGELIDYSATNTTVAVVETGPVLVNLKDTAPWAAAWKQGNDSFEARQFSQAARDYTSALQALGPNQTVQRRWLQFFHALALIAGEQYDELKVYLDGLAPPVPKELEIPEDVTVANFADSLLVGLVDADAASQLRSVTARMPAWAGGLATLVNAYKEREEERYAPAAISFRTYGGLTGTQRTEWAFFMRALALKQARNCDDAARLFEMLGRLRSSLDITKAAKNGMEKIPIKAVQTKLSAMLAPRNEGETAPPPASEEPTHVAGPEEPAKEEDAVKNEAAALAKRETEASERLAKSRAEAAKAVQEKLDSEMSSLMEVYDFKGALAKCKELQDKLGGEDRRKAFEEYVARVQLLADFKAQIITDIAQKPISRSDLETRNKAAVDGRLWKATDEQLMFRAAAGDSATSWDDLPPKTMMNLAEAFASGIGRRDTIEQRVKRYKMLEAFCQQYQRPDDAKRFYEMADKLEEKPSENN
jgi:serine/threonine protein kinase